MLAFAVFATKPALPAIAVPEPKTFDPALVRQGATLAAIGNCGTCHSAPDKPPFSGGVPVKTSFGTVMSTNITPDGDTGIGRWSAEAFNRAMREGVDREGRPLTPAFAHDHFTRVTDADNAALYAYLMTRIPTRAATPANDVMVSLKIRAVVAGWKLLFFRPGAWQPDPTRDPAWNRGAYLVEGLGHCGACHTPRNALGAERADAPLAGGTADGWTASALNEQSPAPIAWTVDAMTAYLDKGWHADHGVAHGPMAAVTAELAPVPEADLSAMGTYLVSLMGIPSTQKQARARERRDRDEDAPQVSSTERRIAAAADPGAAIYAAVCGSCHSHRRPLPFGGLDLELSTATHAPDPTNILHITLHGLPASSAAPDAMMPGFAGTLNDRQIVDLLQYLRGVVAQEPPWPDLTETVRAARAIAK